VELTNTYPHPVTGFDPAPYYAGVGALYPLAHPSMLDQLAEYLSRPMFSVADRFPGDETDVVLATAVVGAAATEDPLSTVVRTLQAAALLTAYPHDGEAEPCPHALTDGHVLLSIAATIVAARQAGRL
jgi:hypothetical protein